MRGAAVWRAGFDDASLTAIFADHLDERALSMDEFVHLKATLTQVPAGVQRAHALKRIEKLNPSIVGNEASAQKNIEKGRLDAAAYRTALADQLQTLACSEDKDALHIVRGLIANGRIKDTGAQAFDLISAILKLECPVSVILTEADKAALNNIAKKPVVAH